MNQQKSLSTVVEESVPVSMRDGIVLRADVYRPSGKGAYPVLLCRTPYNKAHERYLHDGHALAAQGYIVVVQDTRGRFASAGEFIWMFANSAETQEGPDGYDTVEWAAALPGSDGRVGTFGNSYDGYTSWMAAGARPPSLKALYASGMSPGSLDMTFGIFDMGRRLQWAYARTGEARRRAGQPGPQTPEEAEIQWERVERQKWIWFLPLDDLPERAFSTLTQQLKRHFRQQTINAWDFSPLHSTLDIPTCQNTGWYDRLNGTIGNFTGLAAHSPAATREQHRLVVGPWGHSVTKLVAQQGVMDYGAAANTTYATLVQRWYDHQFKGIDNGLADEPPVNLFVMGPNHWRQEAEWPLARTRFTPYYLHSAGGANTPAGNGLLSPETPASEPPDRYAYDPRDPVMSLMGLESHLAPCDQSPLDDREDVLVYQTPALSEPMEITGPVVARLWVSSDCPDTDFTAKLVLVQANGLAVNLCHGIARASQRNGFDQKVPLVPGEPVEIVVPLLPTSVVIDRGQRLRLDISSSDFPNFDRNHNTGQDFWSDPELRVARQKVFHDSTMASHVLLPIIPR